MKTPKPVLPCVKCKDSEGKRVKWTDRVYRCNGLCKDCCNAGRRVDGEVAEDRAAWEEMKSASTKTYRKLVDVAKQEVDMDRAEALRKADVNDKLRLMQLRNKGRDPEPIEIPTVKLKREYKAAWRAVQSIGGDS